MFALRSRTIQNIKSNFSDMYSSLLCPFCKENEDTQEHLLLRKVVRNIVPLTNHIAFEHMGGTTDKQTDFPQTFKGYLKI